VRIEERPHLIDLIRKNLDQEHVSAARRQLERELVQEIRLKRTHANHEEASQSHGQQDDARLVPRTAKTEDGVT